MCVCVCVCVCVFEGIQFPLVTVTCFQHYFKLLGLVH